MAEGYARHLRSEVFDAYSAGVDPHGMNPSAIAVMFEDRVDITSQHSKHIDSLNSIVFDYIVTVCDKAHDTCPVYPGNTRVVHVGFDDPPKLAQHAKTPEEALNQFRRVRDQIKQFIAELSLESLDVLDQKGAN